MQYHLNRLHSVYILFGLMMVPIHKAALAIVVYSQDGLLHEGIFCELT